MTPWFSQCPNIDESSLLLGVNHCKLALHLHVFLNCTMNTLITPVLITGHLCLGPNPYPFPHTSKKQNPPNRYPPTPQQNSITPTPTPDEPRPAPSKDWDLSLFYIWRLTIDDFVPNLPQLIQNLLLKHHLVSWRLGCFAGEKWHCSTGTRWVLWGELLWLHRFYLDSVYAVSTKWVIGEL